MFGKSIAVPYTNFHICLAILHLILVNHFMCSVNKQSMARYPGFLMRILRFINRRRLLITSTFFSKLSYVFNFNSTFSILPSATTEEQIKKRKYEKRKNQNIGESTLEIKKVCQYLFFRLLFNKMQLLFLEGSHF
jgi:hypothetical protein